MVGVVEGGEVVGVDRGVAVEAGRRLGEWMMFVGRSVRAVDELWDLFSAYLFEGML